jgi:hypothetical protein
MYLVASIDGVGSLACLARDIGAIELDLTGKVANVTLRRATAQLLEVGVW